MNILNLKKGKAFQFGSIETFYFDNLQMFCFLGSLTFYMKSHFKLENQKFLFCHFDNYEKKIQVGRFVEAEDKRVSSNSNIDYLILIYAHGSTDLFRCPFARFLGCYLPGHPQSSRISMMVVSAQHRPCVCILLTSPQEAHAVLCSSMLCYLCQLDSRWLW